jgi:Fic family protein
MRKPKEVPGYGQAMEAWKSDPDLLVKAMASVKGPTVKGKYLHWDDLRFRKPPKGLSHRQWWFALKSHRSGLLKPLPFKDAKQKPFFLGMPDAAWEEVHFVDKSAAGSLEMPAQVTSPQERDRYIINSLMEEAIRSSQIEGAAVTRRVAQDMIRTRRKPRDKNEQMILNNYETMYHIRELKDEPFTVEAIMELQSTLTHKTLDDPGAVGRFRKQNERVLVLDGSDNVLHVPPPAKGLKKRIERLCRFANEEDGDGFIHPVTRAIILHFILAYEHPFVDGNGRCARALFYWSMLKSGYWLCEYISISQVIHNAPARYARAFLHTETDENDLTYFILFHLDILCRAIRELHVYLERKVAETSALERKTRRSLRLNHRQRALLSHALRNPGFEYSVASHKNSHNVVYETARSDLRELVDLGLLTSEKRRRAWYFHAPPDLAKKLKS